jgi:two-component system sensor histidine kinase MprB
VVPFRIIDDAGTVVLGSSFGSELAPDARDVAVATGASGPTRRDRYADGEHFRLATVPVGNGLALQTLRSMADVDGTVRNTTFAFTLIGLAGVAVAAALGILVARSALVPVARLSRAVDGVASRLDLRATVPETGGAELSRLGRSFNTALVALDASRRQQQRLVQDAAHELRTPLTSLRTNVEVLQQLERLAPEERASLLADLSAQLEELSRLVADLGMLSRHDSAETETPTEVRFDRVAAAAVERARPRLPPGTRIEERLEPCVVVAVPDLLERAVLNLVDNAAKWGPPGEPVTVTLCDGELTVSDRGPGIPPEERTLVFERFWRSPSARAQPGSGLGLSIVRQIADAHGGRVAIDDAPGGGTRVHLWMPASAVADVTDGVRTAEQAAGRDCAPPARVPGPARRHPR